MEFDLSNGYRASKTARRMAEAAQAWLASLSDSQRQAAAYPFDSGDRYVWNYRPDGIIWNGQVFVHPGLRLISMSPPQQQLALALFDIGLSEQGASRARQIMALEPILREAEKIERRAVMPLMVRDPEIFSFAVFGEPGGRAPWAWHAGGHHIGVHFTVIGQEHVASAPLFLGANPAQVRHGPQTGLRTLPEEEDLARTLLRHLDAERRSVAVVKSVAPSDILTDAYRSLDPNVVPSGLRFAAMTGDQREQFVRLIRLYVERVTGELATNEWRKIEGAGLDGITFAWAGPDEPGQGHYYAIKGPTFLVEYDNTQNGANHIHTVWRDLTSDWGEDLLAHHYATAHPH